jgi:hypothetical protein
MIVVTFFLLFSCFAINPLLFCITELMADPEVGPFLQKFMGKIMGGGGGMGMPGGMGSAPMGGGGFGEDMPDFGGEDDLDDMPDLVD